MSRKLEVLNNDFCPIIKGVLVTVLEKGHELRPFYTIRTPAEQSKLWRQSRTTEEIRRVADRLVHEGADGMARILLLVGPQSGRWATNALPGQSWHQWGEAIDCMVISEFGRAVWSSGHPGYQVYAEEAKKQALVAGFFWKKRDAVHVQYRSESVRASYTWKEINETMLTRFGRNGDEEPEL